MVANGQTAGVVFDIKRFAVHDGPGIRTAVYFSGCPLRCAWCHNPEGLALQPDAPKADLEAQGVTRGFSGKVTVAAVMAELERDRVYYEQSGGGITLSGGEPLMQPDFLQALLRACRAQGWHTALDTCGHAPAAVVRSVLPLVDLFLYDLKLLDDAEHEAHTGVSNALILANLRMLLAAGAAVQVRLPVVPGYTDTPANVDALVRLLAELPGCRGIGLLPYHRAATAKYERLGLPYRLAGVPPPTAARLGELRKRFEAHGLSVRVGG